MSKFSSWLALHTSQSETLKNIVEILAIILAATWAVYKFISVEAPTLEHAIGGYNNSQVYYADDTTVGVDYTIDISNRSKSSFEIDSVLIMYWILSPDTIKTAQLFDIDYFESSFTSDFYYSVKNGILCTHYSVSEEAINIYKFYFKANYNQSLLLSYIAYGHFDRFGVFSKQLRRTGSSFILHLTQAPAYN